MRRILLVTIVAVLGSVGLVACGTIMHGGGNQGVGFSSTPTGARVSLNNKDLGVTPVIASLSRKDNHLVRFTMDGYQPMDVTLTRGVSGWVWGNLVFGGLVGLAVDAISGGLYKLTPDQVAVTMAKPTASAKDGLYIAVVMRPDPRWQKIGTLTAE